MKLPGLIIAGCLWITMGCGGAQDLKELAVPELIKRLADEDFKTREAATLELWKRGEKILPDLREVAEAADPEKAFRAADLINKIENAITPETDPAVLGLVERYRRAGVNDKMMIYRQLTQLRAWRQMLKLYSRETPGARVALKQAVNGVAVIGARERLLVGDEAGAKEYLELGPADPNGLLALAAFHRARKTLPQEIQRVRALKSDKMMSWLLALYRVDGNIAEARKTAETMNERRLAAMMAFLEGDPLPWLRQNGGGNTETLSPQAYTQLAIRRWEGKDFRKDEMEPLVRMLSSKNDQNAWQAMASLFLLGQKTPAEQALIRLSPQDAFQYMDMLERPKEALQIMGFNPGNPDFNSWAAKLIPNLARNDEDDVTEVADPTEDLRKIAHFLEKRGCHDLLAHAYLPPLKELAAKDPGAFQDFLGGLFQGSEGAAGVGRFAARLGIEWAGDDKQRWRDLLLAAVGEEAVRKEWWEWMEDLDPGAGEEEKFRGMIALFTTGADPDHLRERWLARAWDVINRAPEAAREKLAQRVYQVCLENDDVKNFMKAWRLLSAGEQERIINQQTPLEWNKLVANFGASGSWPEAADFFLRLIKKYEDPQQRVRPQFYAYAASALRRCGREKEAREHDEWAEKLALGDAQTSIQIAYGYSYSQDYERSRKWILRAIVESEPDSAEFNSAIELQAQEAMEAADWKQAAAMAEVIVQMQTTPQHISSAPVQLLRTRLQADLARGLVDLKTDKSRALAVLESCHSVLPGDGSLADYFFPAVRKAGLIKEHDAWFEESWGFMQKVIQDYPGADNTLNSAGWLAARAARRLNEAEALLNRALALSPAQPAFLDTMAEIQFARGDRKRALEWSDLSLNYSPGDPQIRRQNLRFRTGPMQK